MLLLAHLFLCAKRSIQTLKEIIISLSKNLSPSKTKNNLNFASRTQRFVFRIKSGQTIQIKA